MSLDLTADAVALTRQLALLVSEGFALPPDVGA